MDTGDITNGTILDWKLDAFSPHPMFNINVHVDGMEATHDSITNRPGTFRQICENIKITKKKGFTICTNTTVYKETNSKEIEALFRHLQMLGVDGMLVSPSFEFENIITPNPPLACPEQSRRVKVGGGGLFMKADEISKKFREIRDFAKKYRTWSTPLYLDFLAGLREYKCTPWGNVTYNIEGWKAPCYLITDRHYENYNEFIRDVNWNKYQSREDTRCKNCMVHSGFEASVALETGSKLKDALRMAWWTIF